MFLTRKVFLCQLIAILRLTRCPSFSRCYKDHKLLTIAQPQIQWPNFWIAIRERELLRWLVLFLHPFSQFPITSLRKYLLSTRYGILGVKVWISYNKKKRGLALTFSLFSNTQL
ncbi:hypothetical protein RHMOL_Rhmol01G0222400 [Rhododendron molle]|uniref:Uncharacterized protein n=1 Tax=Rhododendron molle TaxID=49168 RepID=A0ACC0Q4Q6_RHOML|nr:hypothetical protein RHMOL_Rhmol01G0222400 [Rhododendron molle]